MPKHTAPDREVKRVQSKVNRLAYRINYLPTQLANAYRKVDQLEREARLLGMNDIIRTKGTQTNDS